MKRILVLLIIWVVSVSTSTAQWKQTSLKKVSVVSLVSHGNLIFANTFIDNAYYFGTDSLYTSSNNGVSWVTTYVGENEPFCIAIDSEPRYIGTFQGVYRSNNSEWFSEYVTSESQTVTAIAISAPNVFAATSGVPDGPSPNQSGLSVSKDSGVSWMAIGNGLTHQKIEALQLLGPNCYAATDSGVFVSTNNGTSWAAIDNGLPAKVPAVYCFAIADSTLFIGTSVGVYSSADSGADWVPAGPGLPSWHVTSLAFWGKGLYAIVQGNIYASTEYGTPWRQMGISATASSLCASGWHLFAGTTSAGVWEMPAAYASFSATSLDFGSLPYNQKSSQTCMIRNYSDTTMWIFSAGFSGPNAADFQLTGNTHNTTMPFELQPGDSVGLTITYTAPSMSETDQATLRVNYVQLNDSAYDISLSGSSFGYLTLSTNSLNYGVMQYPETNTLQCLITNQFYAPISIDSAVITGPNAADFVITGNTRTGSLPYQLRPQSDIGFNISYSAPATTEADNATLRIYYDGSSDSLFSIALNGTSKKSSQGVASAASTAALQLSINPNPSTGSSTITIVSGEVSGTMHYEVYDLLGRQIYQSSLGEVGVHELHTSTFDGSTLLIPNGVYSVRAGVGSQMATGELLLTR